MASRREGKDLETWRVITPEELEKHADVDNHDAWMAIKGIVYDVSAYAAVHPGGADKISKYAGKDATETFDMVHPYVDFEAILCGYQVAILKDHPQAPKRSICQSCFKCGCVGKRYRSPTTYFKQDSIAGTYFIEFQDRSQESDWTIGILDKAYLVVFKCIKSKKAWLSIYELPEPLANDKIELEFKHDYRHAEVTLRKPIPTTVWANQTHGLKEAGQFVHLQEGHSKFDAFIIFKKCLTPDVLMFGIQITDSARIGVPIGFHVNFHLGDMVKPYTPVCFSILETDIYHEEDNVLYFMIKIYPEGKMSRAIDELELDEGKEIPTLKLSTPYGYFKPGFIQDFGMLFLIAGGSGLTPMVKIMRTFWNIKDKMHGRRVMLMYFCQKDQDLIWKKQFLDMQSAALWFYYFPVLSRPSTFCNWKGLTGKISADLVKKCLGDIQLSSDMAGAKKACICGPPGFNSASVASLAGIVLKENIFVFSG